MMPNASATSGSEPASLAYAGPGGGADATGWPLIRIVWCPDLHPALGDARERDQMPGLAFLVPAAQAYRLIPRVLTLINFATAVSRLTLDHVQTSNDEVRLRLGHEPVVHPEPLASLVLQLVATRRGHAAIGDQGTSPWLSPAGNPAAPSARSSSPNGSASSACTPDDPARPPVSTRHRPARRVARPYARHPHQRRRCLATRQRRRLDRLRGRRQPPRHHGDHDNGGSPATSGRTCTTMSNYRYRVQTSKFGLFAGVTAQVVHPETQPVACDPISDRVWIETSQVADGFRGTPLPLSSEEAQWLQRGLRQVVHHIEDVDQNPYIVVAVQALEIVLVDYVEEALAPAIAGWAAQEFGFVGPHVTVRLDEPTRQYTFQWHS